MAKKNILILGGSTPIIEFAKTAQEMNLNVTISDLNLKPSALSYCNHLINCSIDDVETLKQYCLDNNIQGIINPCVDKGQYTQLVLSKVLNYNTYGTDDIYNTFLDKTNFKNFCLTNGLDCPKAINNNTVFPRIIKPVHSSGSRNVKICNSLQDLNDYHLKNIISEEYLGNYPNITVTYIISNGHPYLISIGDIYNGTKDTGLQNQFSYTIYPSVFSDLYLRFVNDKAKNALINLCLKNAVCFMQGFIVDNDVKFYDSALRFPGNDYNLLLRQATGVDLYKDFINYAIGYDLPHYTDDLIYLNNKIAIQYILNGCGGPITQIRGFDNLYEIPGVIDYKLRCIIGDFYVPTGDIQQRLGEVSILLNDRKDIKTIIDKIYSQIQILDTDCNNIIVPHCPTKNIQEVYW